MRDILLPATPANARRMVEASRITNLELQPEIKAMARTGLISLEEFAEWPVNASVHGMVQKLVDYEANAVIRFDDRQEDVIMNGILAALNFLKLPVVTMSDHPAKWPKYPDMKFIDPGFSHRHLTKEMRGGAIITDHHLRGSFLREFRHVIILSAVTVSSYRSRFTEREFLNTAIAALFGETPFLKQTRASEPINYPYFNIIDLIG